MSRRWRILSATDAGDRNQTMMAKIEIPLLLLYPWKGGWSGVWRRVNERGSMDGWIEYVWKWAKNRRMFVPNNGYIRVVIMQQPHPQSLTGWWRGRQGGWHGKVNKQKQPPKARWISFSNLLHISLTFVFWSNGNQYSNYLHVWMNTLALRAGVEWFRQKRGAGVGFCVREGSLGRQWEWNRI